MKTVLLNPPGKRPYIRDYYCSKTAKADYTYAPVDLLMLSGRLEEPVLVDAVLERMGPRECLERIVREKPGALISLVGAVSWEEDRAFLARVRNRLPQTKILASGDVLLEDGVRIMEQESWLDGIILDFTKADAAAYLAGDLGRIEAMIFRDPQGRVVDRSSPRGSGPIRGLPRPRQELFLNRGYAYPFVRSSRFATVQTDYGCPFSCRFCVMAGLGYQVRPVEEVVAELRKLKQAGVREIYFNDQTFGADPRRLERLCRAMKEAGLNLGWCCWSRVDTVQDHLELMKAAGCHTIMFGVESANPESLIRFRKGFGLDQVRETFGRCRELSIRTLATYIIGLPGETAQMVEQTIRFSQELKSDFASFNVLVPRKGTELRQSLAVSGAIPKGEETLDQTGLAASSGWAGLSPEQIRDLRSRAVRGFYARPGYILRRLTGIRSLYDLKTLVKTAATLAWS